MENNWEDIFKFDDQLTEEERMIRDNVREYCQKSLMPRILESNRNETFHKSCIVFTGIFHNFEYISIYFFKISLKFE